jgi:hypothetical protein
VRHSRHTIAPPDRFWRRSANRRRQLPRPRGCSHPLAIGAEDRAQHLTPTEPVRIAVSLPVSASHTGPELRFRNRRWEQNRCRNKVRDGVSCFQAFHGPRTMRT